MSTGPLVRFGTFTDSHYAEKVYEDRYCEDSAAKLRACVETFTGAGLDFAICLGDLIDGGQDRELELGYARTMASLFAEFRGSRYWVMGNHDLESLTKEEFLGTCGVGGPTHYSFEAKGVHFVVLDANCHEDGSDFRAGDFSWDCTWVSEAQIDWLARDLAGAADRPAIVFCHENLDHRLWEGVLDPHVVRNADRVRQAIEGTGNVRAVIEAHYHEGLQTRHNGIPYLCLQAMVTGPGLGNNAYAIVTLQADGRLVVEGFGQQNSYYL